MPVAHTPGACARLIPCALAALLVLIGPAPAAADEPWAELLDAERLRASLEAPDADTDALLGEGRWHLLHAAAEHGHEAVVELLLARLDDPSLPSHYGQTPLHRAALAGRLAIVERLIGAGHSLNLTDHGRRTALHAASAAGHADVVRALLVAGADPERFDEGAFAPIDDAVSLGHADVVFALLEAQPADVRRLGELFRRAVRQGHAEVAAQLILWGAPIEGPGVDGERALHLAALQGGPGLVRALLALGADPLATDAHGATALHFARDADSARALVLAGADPKLLDGRGRSTASYAGQRGDSEVLALLLGWGAEPAAVDLPIAAARGYDQVVARLLDRAIPPGTTDAAGESALMLAVKGGHADVVRRLLAAGADPHAKDADGRGALHRALEVRHEGIAEALLAAGAKIGEDADEALLWAASARMRGVVRALLAQGARVSARALVQAAMVDPVITQALLEARPPVEVRAEALRAAVGGEPTSVALIARSLDGKRALLNGALCAALRSGQAADARMLLEEGAQRDARCTERYPSWEDGKSVTKTRREPALMQAGRSGGVEVVEVLLEAGAKLGRLPLVASAVLGGGFAKARWLLGLGADPNAGLPTHGPPLHLAVRLGNRELAVALSAAGARTDTQDPHGDLPLHIAAEAGSAEMVNLLLGAGAELELLDQRGLTALERAARVGAEDAAHALIQAGAWVSAETAIRLFDKALLVASLERDPRQLKVRLANGITLLHLAAQIGNEEAVEILLDAGIDGHVSVEGWTAYRVARLMDHEDVVRVLERKGVADKPTEAPEPTSPERPELDGALPWAEGSGAPAVGWGGAYGEDGSFPPPNARATAGGKLAVGLGASVQERVAAWDMWGAAFEEDPSVNALLVDARRSVGEANDLAGGERSQREALMLVRRHAAPDVVGPMRFDLAWMLHAQDRHEPALSQLEAMEEVLGGASPPPDKRPLVAQTKARTLAALGRLEEARALARGALGQSWEHSGLWKVAGAIDLEIGYYDGARQAFARALALRRRQRDPGSLEAAWAVNDLAVLARRVGDLEAAGRGYRRYLMLLEDSQRARPVDLALGMVNLADVEQRTGDVVGAEERLREAKRVLDQGGVPKTHYARAAVAWTRAVLLDEAADSRAAGALAEALEAIEAAWGPSHPLRALALVRLGQRQLAAGRLDEAEARLMEALEVVAETEALEARWVTLHAMSELMGERGVPAAAILFGKRAVNAIEALRAELETFSKDVQSAFVDQRSYVYRRLADRLIAEGRLVEAQRVMELLKREELWQFTTRGMAGGRASDEGEPAASARAAPLDPRETVWQERYEAISGRLAGLGREVAALKDKRRRRGLTAGEKAQLAQLKSDMIVARKAFRDTLEQIRREITAVGAARATEVGKKNLDSLRGLQGKLKRLGEGTVLVHYLVMPRTLRILVTTPEMQLAREVEVEEAALNKEIHALRKALERPSLDPRGPAHALYGRLIAPIIEDLDQAGAKTLLVSLDGALRYVPMAALYDGTRWLVERLPVVRFNEAARDHLGREPAGDWRVAGLGVTKTHRGFSPLPSVKRELAGIIKDRPRAKGLFEGEVLLDERFTLDALERVLDDGFPVVHVASHFVFQPGTERDSYLLLGDGGALSLEQMRFGDFSLAEVELLTLSACQTAVGGRGSDGREIEGFGAMAQKMGAGAVLASLWPVADTSTAELMVALYAARKRGAVSKVEALREAQLAMIQGKLDAGELARTRGLKPFGATEVAKWKTDKRRPHAHPYYWSAFVLMGNHL